MGIGTSELEISSPCFLILQQYELHICFQTDLGSTQNIYKYRLTVLVSLHPCITNDCFVQLLNFLTFTSAPVDGPFDFESYFRADLLTWARHRDWFIPRPSKIYLRTSKGVACCLKFYDYVPLVRKNEKPMLQNKLYFCKDGALSLRWRVCLRPVLKNVNLRRKRLRLEKAWRCFESYAVYLRVMTAYADPNSTEYERSPLFVILLGV